MTPIFYHCVQHQSDAKTKLDIGNIKPKALSLVLKSLCCIVCDGDRPRPRNDDVIFIKMKMRVTSDLSRCAGDNFEESERNG